MGTTSKQQQPVQWTDRGKLFVGAFAQWALATAFTRFAVLDGNLGVFATVFAAQTLWWVNIQQTTRSGTWTRWLAWTSGAAIGAVAGKILTGGL